MNLRPLTYPELGNAGRLGNQLWEIASTVGLARDRSMRPLFPAEWPYREFFECPNSWFGSPQPRMSHSTAYARDLDPRCRSYLQDLSLWDRSSPEIQRAFAPSRVASVVVDAEWAEHFSNLAAPICAVHIRRGDYATNPSGTLTSLPIDYYLKAINELEPGSVVVFSDDIAWCRKEFPWAELYYEGVPRSAEQAKSYKTEPVFDWIDLFLMARCANQGSMVISNSTYSWWGGFLAEDCQRICYPSRWYGDELSSYIDFRSMIPSDPKWVEIEVPE